MFDKAHKKGNDNWLIQYVYIERDNMWYSKMIEIQVLSAIVGFRCDSWGSPSVLTTLVLHLNTLDSSTSQQ